MGGVDESEHENVTLKRQAQHKRMVDSTHKNCRSSRLKAKESRGYKKLETKAGRVQATKVEFLGAFERLHAALAK